MNKLSWITLSGTTSLLLALTLQPTMAQSKSKEQTCKLQSNKVKGKERTCIYVCKDKSLEGRTRAASNSCPAYINSVKY